MDPYKDVDICVALVHKHRPTLPLREELPSLGAETIYAPRGTASKIAKKNQERKDREFRQDSIKKEDIVCYGTRDDISDTDSFVSNESLRSSLTYEDIQSIRTFDTLGTLGTLTEKSKEDDDTVDDHLEIEVLEHQTPENALLPISKEELSTEDWLIDFKKRLVGHEIHYFKKGPNMNEPQLISIEKEEISF